jgi:hypothetical protein
MNPCVAFRRRERGRNMIEWTKGLWMIGSHFGKRGEYSYCITVFWGIQKSEVKVGK